MAFSQKDKYQVYLACKPIFTGPNLLIRKAKTIRNQITGNHSSLRKLIPGFYIERVTMITKELLEKGVFQSDMVAKLEFPEQFMSSSEGHTRKDASTVKDARSTEQKGNMMDSTQGRKRGRDEYEEIDPEGPPKVKIMDVPVPPIPSSFPYHTQHTILCTVQHILEEASFNFARKYIPEELWSNGIDCASAAELTKWTSLIAKWAPQLPDGALYLTNETDLEKVFSATNSIRHIAWHRVPTTARETDSLVVAGMRMMEALRDEVRMLQLEELHFEIERKIGAMETNRDDLMESFRGEIRKIRLLREELDRREDELENEMSHNDKENKALIGRLVEESVGRIFKNHVLDRYVTGDEGEATSEDEVVSISKENPMFQIL